MANIVIPEEYQYLIIKDPITGEETRGPRFLLHDSGADKPNRFLIFCSQQDLDRFVHADTFLGDGTFKVPNDFQQVSAISIYLLTSN